MSTRRELLRLGTLAGVAAIIPGAAGAAVAPQSRPRKASRKASQNLPLPTREQFANQLNTTFVVQRLGQPAITLMLVDVADPALTAMPGNDECFSAVFRGPSSLSLRQDTYAVANKGLGQISLFLVPVGRYVRGARYYEASFNRVVPS
jgi:hypothetical protein